MNDAEELALWTMNYEGSYRGAHEWCLCMKVKEMLPVSYSLSGVRIARVYLKRESG